MVPPKASETFVRTTTTCQMPVPHLWPMPFETMTMLLVKEKDSLQPSTPKWSMSLMTLRPCQIPIGTISPFLVADTHTGIYMLATGTLAIAPMLRGISTFIATFPATVTEIISEP